MNPTEPIMERLRQLVLERQQLRDRGASRQELEANRRAVAKSNGVCQEPLSRCTRATTRLRSPSTVKRVASATPSITS